MKLSTLFVINVIAGLFFGLACLLAPDTLYSFYDMELTAAGKYAAQLQGAAYLGFAILVLFAVKASKSQARRAIVIGLFVHFLAGLIISLKGQLANLPNVYGWSTVAIFAFFTLGYLYFLVKKEPD